MTLPNFVIIGAQKAGTTWLAAMLRQHPDVFMAPREIHFFDREENFRLGLGWYERHFDGASGHKAVGEKTPDYLCTNGRAGDGHREGVQRALHAALPDARLVAVLRNPVERALSAARHLVMAGWVSPWLRLDDLIVGRATDLAHAHGVVDCGFYARHLEAYLELFSREQILVLVYEEDVVADPEGGLRAACEFLDVDPGFAFRGATERRNEARKSRPRLLVDFHAPPLRRVSAPLDHFFRAARYPASRAAVRHLRRLYAGEKERLCQLLGRRLDCWDR
jgi:hypothetical protein